MTDTPTAPTDADPSLYVHGRLLDGTRLCPHATSAMTTVFLDVVTCPVCQPRFSAIVGREPARPAAAGAHATDLVLDETTETIHHPRLTVVDLWAAARPPVLVLALAVFIIGAVLLTAGHAR